ncbi:MAG: hypothetical protein RIC55_11005 [Pirellulaceae bacterium]
MRISLIVLALVCLSIGGCTQAPSPPSISGDPSSPEDPSTPPVSSQQNAAVVGDLSVGEPVQFANLTVFPVISKTARSDDRFITLDEGLKAGTIEIVEVGGGSGMNPAPNVDAAPSAVPNGAAQTTDESNVEQSFSGLAPAVESGDDPFADDPPAEGETNEADASADDGARDESPENAPTEPKEDATQEEAAGGDLIQASDFAGLTPAAAEEPVEESGLLPTAPTTPPTFSENPSNAAAEPESASPPSIDTPSIQNRSDVEDQVVGNDVNRLLVINRSDRPLYLMPGEIIVGGSQDRTIGQELVIAPGGEPTPIDVFCVEAQRWGGRSSEMTAALLAEASQNSANAATVALSDGATPEQAAKQAGSGKFVASVGNLSRAARLAVQQAGDQGEVWDKVAVTNAKSGVQVASGAFTHNYVDQRAVQRLEPYLTAIQEPVAGIEQIVGVVVAVNGELQTIDVFESTPLFRKLWPKLLKSYALDAAIAESADASDESSLGGSPAEDKPTYKWQVDEFGALLGCTRESAGKFLAEAVKARLENSETTAGVALVHRQGEGVVTFSAHDPTAEADSAAPSEALHISAFAQ